MFKIINIDTVYDNDDDDDEEVISLKKVVKELKNLGIINDDNLKTVADLKAHLANKNDQWQHVFANSALLTAVNHDMVNNDHSIKSGDEVAFFPPVTGG